jgi:hypothetical protein
MNSPLSDRERPALGWLRDENLIQRNLKTEASGKVIATELDISGGLNALIHLLRSGEPLHPQLRFALAKALDPMGDSVLQLRKRLRRGPGRPPKNDTVRSAVRDAAEVKVIPEAVEAKRKAIQKKRPQAAVGEAPRPVSTKEAIESFHQDGKKGKISKSKYNGLLRRRIKITSNTMKNKDN